MQLIINPAAMIEFSSKLSRFCSTGSFLQAASYDIHGQSKHGQSKHTAHTKHKASSSSDAHGGSWETQPHIMFLFLHTRPLITSKSGESDHHQRKALGPLLHPVYIQYAQINSCYSIQLNDGTHTFSLVLKTMNFEVSRNARICGSVASPGKDVLETKRAQELLLHVHSWAHNKIIRPEWMHRSTSARCFYRAHNPEMFPV